MFTSFLFLVGLEIPSGPNWKTLGWVSFSSGNRFLPWPCGDRCLRYVATSLHSQWAWMVQRIGSECCSEDSYVEDAEDNPRSWDLRKPTVVFWCSIGSWNFWCTSARTVSAMIQCTTDVQTVQDQNSREKNVYSIGQNRDSLLFGNTKSNSFNMYAWHAVGLQCWVNFI